MFFPPEPTTPTTCYTVTIPFGSGVTQQYFQSYLTPIPQRSVPRGHAARPGYRDRYAYAPRTHVLRTIPRPEATSLSAAPINHAAAPEANRLSAGESGKRTKRTQKLHNRKGKVSAPRWVQWLKYLPGFTIRPPQTFPATAAQPEEHHMANTRAKLVCVSKTHNEENYVTVHLTPVVGGTTHENDAFFAASPSGSVTLKMTADAAANFETGKNYYSDFSPAPI